MTELQYKEPLARMGIESRVLAKVISASLIAMVAVSAVVFIFSDSGRLFYIGILLGIFSIEGIVNRKRAKKNLRQVPKEGVVNVGDYFSVPARDIITDAVIRAEARGTGVSLELLKTLVEEKAVNDAFKRLNIQNKDFSDKLYERITVSETEKTADQIYTEAAEIAKKSFEIARDAGEKEVTPIDIFAAIASKGEESAQKLFKLFEINEGDIRKAALFGRVSNELRRAKTVHSFASRTLKGGKKKMNRAWTSRPTPVLDSFGHDVTSLTERGMAGLLIGHEKEYERMVDILSKPTKPNALLIGVPGVGKDSIVAHLAYKIAKDEVPAPLFDKRLVALDIAALCSGADQAELESRIKTVFREIDAAKNIILYIPDTHNLSRTSGEARMSAANILIPIITADDFPTIGTTYPKEYKTLVEGDTSFSGAFETIKVEELSESEAEEFLSYQSALLERDFRVTISFDAIKKAVSLAKRFFRTKPLPSSAEELIKEAISEAKRTGELTITDTDIIDIAEKRVNIPIRAASADEAGHLLNLEDSIHERMIDQEEAVSAVSRALREYRSGIGRQKGPIASFLFVGPTGVGKTELAKNLARIQFGSEENMIRLDMSEFQDEGSVTRLLGSFDGKIRGLLSESVLENPYSLVLLDEFEKASGDVLNVFLQALDDARITDGTGRLADMSNTIIIATSNAESEFIKESIDGGKSIDSISAEIKRRLVSHFRPELINRFSEVIVFKTLSESDIEKIAFLQLKELSKIMEENRGIDLSFTEEAVREIGKQGFDPSFGARPLRGVISKKIKDTLASMILKGDMPKGSTVSIDFKDGEFVFEGTASDEV